MQQFAEVWSPADRVAFYSLPVAYQGRASLSLSHCRGPVGGRHSRRGSAAGHERLPGLGKLVAAAAPLPRQAMPKLRSSIERLVRNASHAPTRPARISDLPPPGSSALLTLSTEDRVMSCPATPQVSENFSEKQQLPLPVVPCRPIGLAAARFPPFLGSIWTSEGRGEAHA